MTSRVPGSLATFMQNPAIYASQALFNGGFSDYNALQLELRRQFRNGVFGQVNYTLSNTNTDSAGTAQNRFEAFMDNFRPQLNTGRSVFHQTHVINANAIYELPFGRRSALAQLERARRRTRRRLAAGHDPRVAERIADQHHVRPRHVQPRRALQLHRPDRLQHRVQHTLCRRDQGMLGIFKQPDGKIYWIDPKVVDATTGRAVGADNLSNSANFNGQVFFNPAAGDVGNLPVLTFDGPAQFRMDLALSKRIRLTDRYRFELKGEAINLTNTPSFFRGDMDINSTTFGRITSVNVGSRIIQLSARFDF